MDFIEKTYTVEEIDQIAETLTELKGKKDVLEKSLKEVIATFDLVKESFIEAMGEVGKSSWKIEGMGSFSVSEKAYPRIIKDHENVKALMSWMQSKGEDYYLSHATVNHMTLGRMFKEEREANPEAQIPGVDSSYVKKTVSIRKK